MIKDIIIKRKFDIVADRLGPDCPFTHWRLYFRKKMKSLCQKRFIKFDSSAEFRPGAYAITCSKISIGKNVIIRPNAMIFADPREGDAGSVVIHDDVMLGSGVHIYTSNHTFDLPDINLINQGHGPAKTVTLEDGCWLGANVIVLPGVTIGSNSVVGAGSVVTRDVPTRTVYAGTPARLVKKLTN